MVPMPWDHPLADKGRTPSREVSPWQIQEGMPGKETELGEDAGSKQLEAM